MNIRPMGLNRRRYIPVDEKKEEEEEEEDNFKSVKKVKSVETPGPKFAQCLVEIRSYLCVSGES